MLKKERFLFTSISQDLELNSVQVSCFVTIQLGCKPSLQNITCNNENQSMVHSKANSSWQEFF